MWTVQCERLWAQSVCDHSGCRCAGENLNPIHQWFPKDKVCHGGQKKWAGDSIPAFPASNVTLMDLVWWCEEESIILKSLPVLLEERLPLRKPLWSGWMMDEKTFSLLCKSVLGRILTSTLRSEMGRSLAARDGSSSGLWRSGTAAGSMFGRSLDLCLISVITLWKSGAQMLQKCL